MKNFKLKSILGICFCLLMGCSDQKSSSESEAGTTTVHTETAFTSTTLQADTAKVELFADTLSRWSKQELDLRDTANFNLVKAFIKQKGKASSVNISASVTDTTLMVNYHTVYLEGMEISIDHSDRIYMSANHRAFGNILKEDVTVEPEIHYGVPDTNPELTKEKESRVLDIYRKLLVLALKEAE